MGLWNCYDNVALFVFIWDFDTVPTIWHYLFLYWTLELFRQCGIICFSIGLWNSSDSVGIICFSMGVWDYSHSVSLLMYLLDFGTDRRVWHYLVFHFSIGLYLVFYWALELFPQCGIIGFSMGLSNCSDIVPLLVLLLDFGTVPRVWHYWFFIFLLDFGTVPTVWHYLFLYGTLELFWQCGIICLYRDFGTVPTVWHYLFWYGILKLFWQCGIIYFYMGLWNCSDSVPLLVFSIRLWNCFDSVALLLFLLDFRTFPTVMSLLVFHCIHTKFAFTEPEM